MIYANAHGWLEEVHTTVNNSKKICVAVDQQLAYISLNEVACNYLKLRPEALLGKSAIQVYPEIIASRNHRNILRAMSGIHIPSDIVESRMGDILETSYTPVFAGNEVKAVILSAVVHLARHE